MVEDKQLPVAVSAKKESIFSRILHLFSRKKAPVIVEAKFVPKKTVPVKKVRKKAKKTKKRVRRVKKKRVVKQVVPKKAVPVEQEALRVKTNSIEEIIQKASDNSKSTVFDKILFAVNTRGSIGTDVLAKELVLTQKQIIESALVLQKSGSIRVVYPLVGSVKLVAVKKEESE